MTLTSGSDLNKCWLFYWVSIYYEPTDLSSFES